MPDKIDAPRIVQTEDERYAFIHLVILRSEMHAVLPPVLHELFAAVKAQGLPVVPWFAHHLHLGGASFDFEACIPVAETFVAIDRVQASIWPAGTIARTLYRGDYPGLPAAWGEFGTWIEHGGYSRAHHLYERYTVHQGMTKDREAFVTELSWPLLPKASESEHA